MSLLSSSLSLPLCGWSERHRGDTLVGKLEVGDKKARKLDFFLLINLIDDYSLCGQNDLDLLLCSPSLSFYFSLNRLDGGK